MSGPERLELPNDFPVAGGVSQVVDAGKQQKQWWSSVKRILQEAIEGMRRDKSKFESASAPGVVSVGLGSAPSGTGATPAAWVDVILPDGTAGRIPVWKKG